MLALLNKDNTKTENTKYSYKEQKSIKTEQVDMQRNQTEHLDIRNIKNKIKNSMDGLLSRSHRV